jgi:hypothetical protein
MTGRLAISTITIISVVTIASIITVVLAIHFVGRGGPPSTILTVTAKDNGSNVVLLMITHTGGDELNISDLKVQGLNSDNTTMSTATIISPTGTLSVDEQIIAYYTYGAASKGNVITVYVIHKPSKQRLFSGSVVVR